MYVGISELHRERNDLPAALHDLQRSQDLGQHAGLPQNRYRWCVAMARVRQAQGDLAGELDLLDEAERLYISDFFPNVRPISAMKARVWIAQGWLGEALSWASVQGLSPEDNLSYLREFEHVTLARLLLAQYPRGRTERSIHQAVGLLDRLLRAADEGQRAGSALEILVLQAVADQMRDNVSAALWPLERALTLAEPEGYVRIFVDQGPPMAALLEAAAERGIAASYVRRLLGAFDKGEPCTPVRQDFGRPIERT